MDRLGIASETTNHIDPQTNAVALEQEIDDCVYRLYRLTKDKIKLVEESTKQ